MTEDKPEAPPLSRPGRRIAEAKLNAAKFEPTSDGRAKRKYEVHGIEVTESVSAELAEEHSKRDF
jgi:hypothetical protein